MCEYWILCFNVLCGSKLKTRHNNALVSAVWPADHQCDHKLGDHQYEYYHWLAEVRCHTGSRCEDNLAD